MKIDNFFAQLKRRTVYKVAVVYAVVGWLVVQIATQVFPSFDMSNWSVRRIVPAIVVEFPITLAMCEATRNSAGSKEMLSIKTTWR